MKDGPELISLDYLLFFILYLRYQIDFRLFMVSSQGKTAKVFLKSGKEDQKLDFLVELACSLVICGQP